MIALRWIVSAAAAALAAQLVVHHPTPIDEALPLLAIVVTFLAAASYSGVMTAVPLLLALEIAVADETMRLALFGLVMAASFFAALVKQRDAAERVGAREERRSGRLRMITIAIAAIVLLRWIPFADVHLAREIFLLILAAGIVTILGATPLAAAVAVTVSLFTHLPPGRSLWLPICVLAAAAVGRIFGLSRLRLAWPSAAIVALLMLFFAWSGVVARAVPWFFTPADGNGPRVAVGRALAPGESVVLDVPPTARSLVLAAANASMMKEGEQLGVIEAVGVPRVPITIGDVADWGYMRREHFAGARNPLPDDSAGEVHGWGYSAWVNGAGRLPLPRGARRIRVTADRRLAPNVTLHVERFELAHR